MTLPSSAEQSAVSSSQPVVGRGRAEAVIDLDAISANTERLRAHAGGRDLMAIVKADGYGHGITQAAWAARRGGATWLGVAFLDEALCLRAAGDDGPILSWLAVPGEAYGDGIAAGVELTAYTAAQLREIAAAARAAGARAAVQLKLDSGLGRGGSHPDDWPQLIDEAVRQQKSGQIRITGVWSHFACSDGPEHPSVAAQLVVYEEGLAYAVGAGLEPEHRHLANSGATLSLPQSWFTMVRPGIALYGVSPFPDGRSPIALVPAMTLRSVLALVKRVHAGQGVSYGHTYVTDRETTLGLIPLGYGDGIPRQASNRGVVAVEGAHVPVAGRVCMDQFVVDLGGQPAAVGDEVVVFGDSGRGEPTARDWANAADTIGYEIVTRVGARVPRVYLGTAA
jgi:alanine racemase